jgi:hypothetical protein
LRPKAAKIIPKIDERFIIEHPLRGSMIQITASVIAIKAFAAPLFSLLAILAAYELVDTLIKSLRNSITLYKLSP